MTWIAVTTAVSITLADFSLQATKDTCRYTSCEELVSLYAVSDICFVSSIRDGMNLVACEYTSTQKNIHGVLLLSEFTGAVEHFTG
jgi:trehalose-6-phosphate synthase